jgi:hypothetical protein
MSSDSLHESNHRAGSEIDSHTIASSLEMLVKIHVRRRSDAAAAITQPRSAIN